MTGSAFHHVVLFRLRAGVTLDRVRAARSALQDLVETLPGVLHFAVTDNLSDRNGGYTLALFSAFEDRRAFEIFQRHPEWQRVHDELLTPVVEHSVVAQGSAD
ncbi:MAG: Dabb family protein [Planctomycetes bacterium]|nr:Dabb family protein [Planctomycetota bacterium]